MPTPNLTPKHFTTREIVAMFDAPAILTHPATGGVQIEKAGITGTGLTVRDAMDDWGRKFAAMIALPKPATN
jgi:hypothetical protein